jgi:lysophospholipase L1-like esterase
MTTLIKITRFYYPLFVSLLVFILFQRTAFALDKVVCMGDSITAGYPYVTLDQEGSRVGGYEPPLEEMLVDSGHQAVALNYGHPGELSCDGTRRIQGIIDKEKPDIVLVMEGTNDLWFYSPESIMTDLASMVNKVIKSGAFPVLATITPDTRGSKPVTQMNDKIRKWAKDNNVQFADQYTALIDNWSSLRSSDNFHPNQDGYNVIAQTWFQAIPLKNINMEPIIMLLFEK